MAKSLSLPCKGNTPLFSEALGTRKHHHTCLDSLALNIILGVLLLSEFIDSFQLNKGFQRWVLSCNSFPVTFTSQRV